MGRRVYQSYGSGSKDSDTKDPRAASGSRVSEDRGFKEESGLADEDDHERVEGRSNAKYGEFRVERRSCLVRVNSFRDHSRIRDYSPEYSRRLDCHKLFHVSTVHNKPPDAAARGPEEGSPRRVVASSDRIHSKQK